MNGLKADHQVKVVMHEDMVKTARHQIQHGMDKNNVLAAFTDLDWIQKIKQETITEQQSQAANTIQRAATYQQQNKKTSVDSHGGLEHRHEPSKAKRKREQGFFMASSKKPCVRRGWIELSK